MLPAAAAAHWKHLYYVVTEDENRQALQRRIRNQRKQLREYQRLAAELRGHLAKATADRESAIERIGT